MATPRSRSRRMIAKRRWTSGASRLEVGSSSRSTRGRLTIARAIATSCCTDGGSVERRAPRSRSSRPRSASTAAARARVVFQSIPNRPRDSWPSMTFSTTLSFGPRWMSWNTVATPAAWLSAGDEKRTGSPSSRISPESTGSAPFSALITVDLPAPFSPMTVCTSPAYSCTSTPSSAVTPGNATVTPRSSMSGPVTAAPSAAGRWRIST